jgi:hypothetical protein
LHRFFFTFKQQKNQQSGIFGTLFAKILCKESICLTNQNHSKASSLATALSSKALSPSHPKAIINGVIEGDLTAEEVLIGPTGRITGRVSAKVIDVRGQLHNTIISEKSLIVRATGKIAGKVQYAEIEIEKGGEIEGTLSQNADGPAIQVGTLPAA